MPANRSDAQRVDERPALLGPVEMPVPAESHAPTVPLSAREKEMLLLEQKWFKFAGLKENEIRDRWDISATRYYQLINQIIDKESALAWDPITVNRLRRLRSDRQRSRSARRLGIES